MKKFLSAYFHHLIWISCILLLGLPKIHHAKEIPSYCHLEPVYGPCNDRIFKWYYSQTAKNCLIFLFGGCPENENVFSSYQDCINVCTGVDLPEEEVITTTLPPKEYSAAEILSQNYVTLQNGTGKTTFTFASPSSFIQIGQENLGNYQIRNRRSISLEFRTRLPHALLAYHGIIDRPIQMKKYELYIMIDQGQLRVKHLFGDYSTTVVVGKGLNRDKFHKVNVLIDPSTRVISATVDSDTISMTIDGLIDIPKYGAENDDLNSSIFIGGLKSANEHLDISYLANPFVGCIRNIELSSTPLVTVPLEPITFLISTVYSNVEENCINKCWDARQPCAFDSQCINHYDHVECDCFRARFKGDACRFAKIPLLTLYGYSYVTFTVYEWMDRVHSDANRISIHFRTWVDDAILFYAAGEIPYHNHIGASLVNSTIHLSYHFGDESIVPAPFQIGHGLTDGNWHTLVINHVGDKIVVQLDKEIQELVIQGSSHHLYIDPDINVGGGGARLKNRQGLYSSNNFVGCIKEVYFNEKSILWELYAKKHEAQYHGIDEPVFHESCTIQDTVPITIPFSESGFRISNPLPEELNLKFNFRTKEVFGTLAYSAIKTSDGVEGFWELQVQNENIQFVLYYNNRSPETSNSRPLVGKFNKRINEWSRVELKYHNGEIHLITDRAHVSEKYEDLFQISPFITLGTSLYKPNNGFVGCIGSVEIGGKMLDARQIVGSEDQIGDIAMDNCQYEDPCSRPKVCEHEGKCSVQSGQISCDCSETGYIGKHCHFAIFKRTCEELALLGYTESGVYKIDIDGNGPFSPAHVKCKFETDFSGETKTIVEHNLANETDIWNPHNDKQYDFRLNLTYREFSPDMLMSLISQSVQCNQYVKYDCFKTRLALQHATWFKAADPNAVTVVSIGDADRNTCPCYTTKSCLKNEVCNCDAMDDKWLSDEGYYSVPDRLGITQLYFSVPGNLSRDSASRLTMGPLECVEANTQRYVVTFKTFGSFLEAPGWKTGDLAFSFRTTRSSAILLYQPLLHHQHNAFSVFLANEHELVFRFILNGGPPQMVVVRSQRPLSGGDWQQVWIDYDLHQVRFQINAEHQMITLPDGQIFGPFESTMYIAGAPSKYLEEEADDFVHDGLIGCFRGLVMNGQVVDLYSYMKFHKADIVKDCSPSCDPNPCKNKAICQENWGSFTCQCQNPWAQSGEFCEKDVNVDGLTFLSQSSFIRKAIFPTPGTESDPIRKILTSSIFANLRTYDSDALVIYANDNLNNFVQIHLEAGTRVVFSWNEGSTIRQIGVGQKALNHGKPVQIALVRNPSTPSTTLHVNNENATVPFGVNLLTEYMENPWANPEIELFSPPRPFAPVNAYYQLLLGGYDGKSLKPANTTKIPGMLGCLRGLKIGEEAITISEEAKSSDVLEGCKMVCDTKPCDNHGLCIEDFQARSYSCNCIHTSYYGKTCGEERGANFQGESFIRRRFKYTDLKVPSTVTAHFGFSTSYSEADTIILAIALPSKPAPYSLIIAINKEGHLTMNEERDGLLYTATIQYQNFVDGSRHSIYFEREENRTVFIVDQEEIRISEPYAKEVENRQESDTSKDQDVGEVFVAGIPENVMASINGFRRFKGCLSNIDISIGNINTSPIEEYMGYKQKEEDAILDGEKFDGIKVGPCAAFSLFRLPAKSTDPHESDLTPDTGDSGVDWIDARPTKEIFVRPHIDKIHSASFSYNTLALIAAIFLGCICVFVGIYAYKLNKKYQRRLLDGIDDDMYFTRRGQQIIYQDPLKPSDIQYTGYNKLNSETTKLIPTPPSHGTGNNNIKPDILSSNLRATGAESPEPMDNEEGIDDENINSSSSEDKADGSCSISNSSNSLNNTEVLDEKDINPSLLQVPPNCSTIPEASEESEHDDPKNIQLIRPIRRNMTPSPVYLSPTVRTFESSPIAMIGGPRYEQMKRTSKDSILSLD